MESQDFRVSIIITSYNQQRYLTEAIDSAINQTLRPHEVIIADDHSVDESVEVIREYASRYPGWIRAIYQPHNMGIPKNRNAALRLVTGDYVAILDGDDRLSPHKLEREQEALHGPGRPRCVYSNVRFIGPEGEPLGVRDREPQPSGDVFVHVVSGSFGILRSMVIDHGLLREVGFMDERLPSYDGFDLTVRLAKRSRFAYVQEPLVDNRVHGTSYQTKMRATDHLRDLELICEKTEPLLADLPAEERSAVAQSWRSRRFRWQLAAALEGKKLAAACAILWSRLITGGVALGDLRWVAAHMAERRHQ
jgi:glycosyltransferase involved in cell wall biosynthesis